MNKELFEKIEINALQMYAKGLDDDIEIILFNTKEELLEKISEKLDYIINLNVKDPDFKMLCDYADFIGAHYMHCELNNKPCVIMAIKMRILEIYKNSLNYEIEFKKHYKKLVELIVLIEKKQKEIVRSLKKDNESYFPKKTNNSNDISIDMF